MQLQMEMVIEAHFFGDIISLWGLFSLCIYIKNMGIFSHTFVYLMVLWIGVIVLELTNDVGRNNMSIQGQVPLYNTCSKDSCEFS